MSKFVIAGCANCPRFARMELLADQLSISLPNFDIFKIVLHPTEWLTWIDNKCKANGWTHDKAKPIAWRELLDRGGKGYYIGAFNEFLEYAEGYYGFVMPMSSFDACAIAKENLATKEEVMEEERQALARIKPLVICITNASSQLAYHLIPRLMSGEVFGDEVEIRLKLLDTEENLEVLQGIRMEVEDCAFPLFRGVLVFSDAKEAFTDAKYIIFLDEIEVPPSVRRSGYLEAHANLFKAYSEILAELYDLEDKEEQTEDGSAAALATEKTNAQEGGAGDAPVSNTSSTPSEPAVTVVLAGPGPVTLQAQVLVNWRSRIAAAPDIIKVFAFAGFEERLVAAFLAKKMQVGTEDIADVVVWGINNLNVHPDLNFARAYNHKSSHYGPPWWSDDVVGKVYEKLWLEEHTMFVKEFMSGHKCSTNLAVQSANMVQRQKASAQLKQLKETEFQAPGSNASKAFAHSPFVTFVDSLCLFFNNLLKGSDPARFFSCALPSDGSYGVTPGLFFSFPCNFVTPKNVSIIPNLELSSDTHLAIERMAAQMTQACQKVGVIPILPSDESLENMRLEELDFYRCGWRRLDDAWSKTSMEGADFTRISTALGLRSNTAKKMWGEEEEVKEEIME